MSTSESVATSSKFLPSSSYTFLSVWEGLFLVVKILAAAKCLVCGKVVQTINKYNLRWHYATHSNEYENYKGMEHTILIDQIKTNITTEDIQDHNISESAVWKYPF